MKKYLHSLRMFFGSFHITNIWIFFGMILAIALIYLIPFSTKSFSAADLVSDLSFPLCIIIYCIELLLFNSLYTYVTPTSPGCKYFLSLPDLSEHFRRAIISVNILTLAVNSLMLVLLILVFRCLDISMAFIYINVLLSLIYPAVNNFIGYIRKKEIRIVIIMCLFSIFGFFMGFFSASGEDKLSSFVTENPVLCIIIFADAAAIFAAGMIFSVLMCKKKVGVCYDRT